MSVTISATAVLLDMDGTLVDSSPVVERVWSDWGLSHGLDPNEVLRVVHGRQGQESMAILLPHRTQAENIADNEQILVREISQSDGVLPIPGAAALLTALSCAPHALVTSANEALARTRMTVAGLSMPELAVTAERVSASKPDPEGFLLAASELAVSAEQCVVFEDSAAGVEAGRRAGMRVVGVGAAARDHGADWAVADLSTVHVTVRDADIEIRLAGLI